MTHQDFVAGHASGSVTAQVNVLRACLVLEQISRRPLEMGQGYRWQRLCAVACLTASALLVGPAPWVVSVAVASVAFLFRDYGLVTGALAAASVQSLDLWPHMTALACLAPALLHGRLALNAARQELVDRSLADAETYAIAIQDKALRPIDVHPQ